MNADAYFEDRREEAEKTPVKQESEFKHYFDAVRGFEEDRVATLVRQRRNLLIGLFITLGVISLMAMAIAMLSPLKTAVPYVIRVDNATGYTDIAPQLEQQKTSYDEVINKFFLSQFVINYESYDWQTVRAMHDNVKLMADSAVFNGYKSNMLAKNSPLNQLKDSYKLKVKIKSVTFLNADTAQIRFKKMVLDKQGKVAPEYVATDWVATMAFDYDHDIKNEGERLLNPLGFNALSYAVDPETTK